MSVTQDEQQLLAERHDAVAEAIASVRAEGLEPTEAGLALLEAIANGEIDEDRAIEELLRPYRG